MEMSGMVPAVLGGMSIAAVVLLGVWRMLAHYEKRNNKAHGKPHASSRRVAAEHRHGPAARRLKQQHRIQRVIPRSCLLRAGAGLALAVAASSATSGLFAGGGEILR